VEENSYPLGAALDRLTEADFAAAGTVFQIGIPPRRVDVITAIDAWSSPKPGPIG